jgi:hypothetical protein
MNPKLSDFTFEQRYWAKNPGVKSIRSIVAGITASNTHPVSEFSGYRLKFRC